MCTLQVSGRMSGFFKRCTQLPEPSSYLHCILSGQQEEQHWGRSLQFSSLIFMSLQPLFDS